MHVVLLVTRIAFVPEHDLRDILCGVAGVAIEAAMGARQRKMRLGIMVEAPERPCIRIVAQSAIGPQASFVMLVPMTGGARQPRILEPPRPVALFAGGDGMASDQGKPRDVVVKGGDASPGALAVALLASGAELAVMAVILAMAGHASRRELVAIEIAAVTSVAFYLCMGLPERKFRVPVVIETDRRPLVLFVAGFALGAVASAMDVLNPVAIDACRADVLVALADVAGRAANVAVGAPQWKFCLVVIVRFNLPPRRIAVAAVACFAETPFVRILCLVAIEASPRRVSEFDVLCVTAAALHRLVGVPQLEIRQRVIERLAVKQDDVRIASLVVAVALRALLFRRIGLTAMKSSRRLTIGGNLLVACKTQSRLRSA